MKNTLQRCVNDSIITKEQMNQLILYFDTDVDTEKIQGKFDLSHLSWAIGLILILFALTIFAKTIFNNHGQNGLIPTLATYSATFLVLSQIFYRKSSKFLSAMFLTISVILAPLIAFLLLSELLNYDFDDSLRVSFIVAIATSLTGIYYRQFPLLIVSVYIGVMGLILQTMSDDLAKSAATWLVIGILTLTSSWILNLKSRLNFPFWINKFAVPEIAYGLTCFVDKSSDHISAWFLLSCLILLAISVYLRYTSFVLTGLAGIVTYLNYSVSHIYTNIYWATLFITAQGSLLIWAGTALYSKRDKIDGLISSHLPKLAYKLRPPVLKEPLSFGLDLPS